MTCIVAISYKDKVYMGADTYGSGGGGGGGVHVPNPKCFINGEFIIGCTSSFRMIDILHYELSVPKVHDDEHDDPDKFIRTVFIKAVKSCFLQNGWLKTDSGVESGGNFIVGYRGNVYEVQNDFSILNSPDYGSSVGSGEDAARASLWTTYDTKMKPTDRVELALGSAEVVNSGVRGPFVIIKM